MRSLTVQQEVIRRSLLTIKQRIAVTKNNQEIEHKLKTTRYKMNSYKKYDKASNPILLNIWLHSEYSKNGFLAFTVSLFSEVTANSTKLKYKVCSNFSSILINWYQEEGRRKRWWWWWWWEGIIAFDIEVRYLLVIDNCNKYWTELSWSRLPCPLEYLRHR